jgi:hypothetical protein
MDSEVSLPCSQEPASTERCGWVINIPDSFPGEPGYKSPHGDVSPELGLS